MPVFFKSAELRGFHENSFLHHSQRSVRLGQPLFGPFGFPAIFILFLGNRNSYHLPSFLSLMAVPTLRCNRSISFVWLHPALPPQGRRVASLARTVMLGTATKPAWVASHLWHRSSYSAASLPGWLAKGLIYLSPLLPVD